MLRRVAAVAFPAMVCAFTLFTNYATPRAAADNPEVDALVAALEHTRKVLG